MSSTRFELFRALVGFSDAISTLRDCIAQLPTRDARVLVEGERGTGHEVVARAVHIRQVDAAGPGANDCRFVPFNCATIPTDLHASELFGFVKGAFPGALNGKSGRLKLAMHGTLFIEECGLLAPAVQAALADALAARAFTAIGEHKAQALAPLNIVVSDIEGLEAKVRANLFDARLFDALCGHRVNIPSLRDRAGDIPLLLTEMGHRAELEGKGTVRFTSAAVDALCAYAWPGNGYELARLFEQGLMTHAGAVIDVDDLPERFKEMPAASTGRESEHAPASMRAPKSSCLVSDAGAIAGDIEQLLTEDGEGAVDMRERVSKLESALIHWAIEASDGVVSSAARRLCINRTTLVEKMRKYGINRSAAAS